MSIGFIIFTAIAIIFIFYIIRIFNSLVTLKNRYINSFSQIDVQLKRRYDLIPSLVEIAKKYLEHERETLEAVIKARNQAAASLNNANIDPSNQEGIQGLIKAENSLQSSLGKLNFVMEAYPELKANENMIKLHEELVTTENKVAYARQFFNDSVMNYNTYRQSFPNIIIANSFGHSKDATMIEFENKQDIAQAPKVSF